MAILGIFLAIQWPLLGIERDTSRRVVCSGNLKKLTVAWSEYASDNGGNLVGTGPGFPEPPSWYGGGKLDLPTSGLDDIDPYAGNAPERSNSGISWGALWPYVGEDPTVYRSPADLSLGSHPMFQNGWKVPRVRSYSINTWMGTGWASGNNPISGLPWTIFRSLESIDEPSNRFVFITEGPASIYAGAFIVDMTSFAIDDDSIRIISYPAGFHAGGSVLSFADGSVSFKRWTDPRTTDGDGLSLRANINIRSPNNLDVKWLQERATR